MASSKKPTHPKPAMDQDRISRIVENLTERMDYVLNRLEEIDRKLESQQKPMPEEMDSEEEAQQHVQDIYYLRCAYGWLSLTVMGTECFLFVLQVDDAQAFTDLDFATFVARMIKTWYAREYEESEPSLVVSLYRRDRKTNNPVLIRQF